MKNVIIALIVIAILVGGYRFIASRKKPPEEKPVEITETEIAVTPTPTVEAAGEIIEGEALGQGLPSSGISSDEEVEIPSQEEIEAIIKEFRQ